MEALLGELENLYADEDVAGNPVTPRLASLIDRMIRMQLPEEVIRQKFQRLLQPLMVGIRHINYGPDRALNLSNRDEETVRHMLSSISVLMILVNRINARRRSDIRNAIDPRYGTLCSSHKPFSTWLFGDELEETVKEMTTAQALA